MIHYCRNVEELKLPIRRELHYLKYLVLNQVLTNSYGYIFELVKLYTDKGGEEDLLA